MKRKIVVLGFIIFSIFLKTNIVLAASTASTGVNQIYIRSLPGKDSNSLYMLSPNTTITLISDTNEKGNGCNSNWFKIEYDKYSGYVCSEFLTNIKWETKSDTTSTTETQTNIESIYKQELAKFPADYQAKIEALHKIYPNAIFKIQKVNVNFNTFASYEYQGYSSLSGCNLSLPKGVSLIEDTNRSRDGLKSTDSWAYNVLTDTFNTNWEGGQKDRWYIPSLNTVKYYMDPRNFLTSTGVFMFEDLAYAEGQYTEANIEKALAGSFMANKKVTGKDNTTFARAFMDAGKKHNVSPFAIIARVLQEIGYNRTTMASGTWTGENNAYYGYYNFYNINASGNSTYETIKNGLAHAKSKGWNNEYDAIVGGASFLAGDYVASGQNTTYLQKFDVYGPCYARHQYMQNVEAPLSESYKVYNTYNKIGMLQNSFIFIVPVYNNMPSSTSLDNPKNNNNYLRNLTINGSTIQGFSYQKYEYTINVSPLISSVEIAATKASSKSSVSGTGAFKLSGKSQTKNIIVTAENGTTKTYKITVTRDADIPIKISEILNTMLINSDGTYISGIKLNTKANEFISNAQKVDKNSTTIIKDSKDKLKTDTKLMTGDKVTITSGSDTKEFTVVIYGDVNKNGEIDALDYVQIKNHLMSSGTLKDASKVAADVNRNNSIDALDYVQIKNHIMGKYTIVQ